MKNVFSWRFLAVAPVLLAGLLVQPGQAAAQAVQFQTVEVGNRRVALSWNRAPGDTLRKADRESCAQLCGSCCRDRLFGGYQVWRGSTPDPSKMVLMRTYSIFDTTWTFTGNERVFVDPDSVVARGCGGIPGLNENICNPLTGEVIAPFNGFPYYYAITYFESNVDTLFGSPRLIEYPVQTTAQGFRQTPVTPAEPCETEAPVLGNVLVVPNPFNPADEFQKASFGRENRVQFINLPCPATVKIFTIAGDHVQTLENEMDNGALDWDLKNGNGDDVKGGIYMFVAETDNGKQSRSGHFVLIR